MTYLAGIIRLTLAMLAGLRPEECDEIGWQEVDLSAGTVTVAAAASKVRQRRIVHLMPAGLAWMAHARKIKARLPLPRTTRRRIMRALRRVMGWSAWPKDILRHTAASYLLAHHQDAGKVALELGNSAGVLLTHYRELVNKADAEKFWGISPKNLQS